MSPDIGNAVFEAVGALLTWRNVARIRQDKVVKGVDWKVTAFWGLWGLWNVWYYPTLGQWYSAGAGVVLAFGNLVWVGHALCYRKKYLLD